LCLWSFILCSALVVTVSVYLFMYQTIKKDRMESLGQVAHHRHQLFTSELVNQKNSLQDLLERSISFCKSKNKRGKVSNSCLNTRLKEHFKDEKPIGIGLLEKNGSRFWSAGDISETEIENLVQKPEQVAFFTPRGPQDQGRPYFVVAESPFYGLQLFLKEPLGKIQSIFGSADEVGKSGETFLADNKGFFITAPRYHSHGSVGLSTKIDLTPMQQCLQGQNSELMDVDYRGVRIIHGFRFVPEIGGGCIMAQMDQAEAFAFVQPLRSNVIDACIFFLVISFILIYFFVNQIINPVKYLADLARLIASGNYNLKSEIKRKDEIGVLSDSFNQMTSSLLQAENKFKLAVENIHDYAITILDTNGYITNWNRGIEKINGYTESEIIGQHYGCFSTEEDRKNHRPEKNLRTALEKGSYEEEGERICKDGKRFIANVIITAVYDELKVHKGYIKITRDITEKKRLEQSQIEAQRANFQKTSFLACMSHEIRTPLNSVIGVTELLMDKNLPKEDKVLLGVAHAAGETLLMIINDILDLSRIEAGEVHLESVPFRLSEQVQICLAMMEVRAREKNIRLMSRYGTGVIDLFIGDPTRLRQIIINLLSNAIKFSEQGTITVEIGASVVRSHRGKMISLLFSVTDEGIGIPEDQKELIFERFKQADETVTRRFGGTGLGLSISKKLVELMHGKIWVTSVVGKGSTFYFTVELKPKIESLVRTLLPKDSMRHMELSITDERSADALNSRLRILLADDSEDNRLIFKAFLKNNPFEILVVENGQAAVDLFKRENFDIVFMDVQMPILDGYSATKEIRKWERLNSRKRCPVIAVTANALDEDLRMSLAAGCDDHMSKPLRKDRLLRLIERYILEEPIVRNVELAHH
jgi:PAS domain S-box-containing protein